MKSICIPCSGAVEIGAYLPIIDSPEFQRLRDCRQLGLNDLVFPGARHTRFEHALGTLQKTRNLVQIQRLSNDDQRHLELFALLHDIGHGPFSHQIEPVLQQNHHDRGRIIIQRLAPQIRQCNADPERILQMLDGEDPLAVWVADRNLGADKLDYLQRDAFHIGFAGVPDLELIQRQSCRWAEGIALNEKFIEEGKRLQKFYSYLHQHGYLNKTALAAQRLLQRAVHEELIIAENAQSLSETLWEMCDSQLLEWLRRAKSPLGRKLAKRLNNRDLYRTCICIKPDGYAYVENAVQKPIALREWPRSLLSKFSHFVNNLDRLRTLEDNLAAAAGLAPGELVLASMPYFTKLLPKDLRIANGGEQDYWLFEKDRDHRTSLESDYLRTFAIRVVVPTRHRQALANHPYPLLEYIHGLL